MTKKEFIDEVIQYGNHVVLKYGDNYIRKRWHLTNEDEAFNYRKSVKSSDGKRHDMGFTINGTDATINECMSLIKNYNKPCLIVKY